ncbi:MAG: cation transporter [Gammaproteobacteria bacterium]|nr:cation transporter [Gammaproteobacteria bacterium]
MADDCCRSTIDVASLASRQRKVLAWVFGINVATFIGMVTASVLSESSALLSGTLDNLGDALTYGLSIAVVGASTQVKARVAFLKGLLILGAALAVAAQIGWRLTDLDAPAAGTMSVAATLNLAANSVCLWLLSPYRTGDVNMSSSWECSRNDVIEGFAVIGAAAAVWLFDSGWPDIVVALILLAIFLRSAARVLRNAWLELTQATA